MLHSEAFHTLWPILSSTNPPKPGYRPNHKNNILEHGTPLDHLIAYGTPFRLQPHQSISYLILSLDTFVLNRLLDHVLAYGFRFTTAAQDFNIRSFFSAAAVAMHALHRV